MGYAGYAPGANSRMTGPLSPLEQSLRGLPLQNAEEILDIIEKLTRNVVSAPREEKYRKLKLSNKKISETIGEVPAALDVMYQMGWVNGQDDAGATLILPPGVSLAFQEHVVKLIDAKDFFKKEKENARRRQLREDRDAGDAERVMLREQMEKDRMERDAAAAVKGPTRASVAQKLGDGAQIVRAADLGIGQSKGG